MSTRIRLRKSDVYGLALQLGVEAHVEAPGDGELRYEFSWGDFVHRCLGTREAWAWLSGFEAGTRHVREAQKRIREAIHEPQA